MLTRWEGFYSYYMGDGKWLYCKGNQSKVTNNHLSLGRNLRFSHGHQLKLKTKIIRYREK